MSEITHDQIFSDSEVADDASTTSELSDEATSSAEELSHATSSSEESEDLKLEVKEQKSNAQVRKDKIIESWETGVNSGRKALSDAPEWVQNIIISKATIEPDTTDSKEAMRELLKEERAIEKFDDLGAQLKVANLTATQKRTVNEEYAELSQTMSADKALEKAIKIAGVNLDGFKPVRGMSIPSNSRLSKVNDKPADGKYPKNLSSKDRLKQFEGIRKSYGKQ